MQSELGPALMPRAGKTAHRWLPGGTGSSSKEAQPCSFSAVTENSSVG